MALASQQTTYATGLNVTAAILNSEFSEIYTNLNSITNAQVNTSAAIAASKLDLDPIAQNPALNNNARLYFKRASGANDSFIYEDTSDHVRVQITQSNKTFGVEDDSSNDKFVVDRSTSLVEVRDGWKLRVYDSTDADSFDIFHDGTNANLDSNVGDVHITSAGGDVKALASAKIHANNSADTASILMYHDDSDGFIETSVGDVVVKPTNPTFRPSDDGNVNLGFTGFKWNTVYASNGTINTSFSWEKRNIKEVESKFCLEHLPPVIRYEWKKEDWGKEVQFGVLADDLPKDVLKWEEDNDTPVGVKQPALLALAIGAIQELEKRVEELEKKNKKLNDGKSR